MHRLNLSAFFSEFVISSFLAFCAELCINRYVLSFLFEETEFAD